MLSCDFPAQPQDSVDSRLVLQTFHEFWKGGEPIELLQLEADAVRLKHGNPTRPSRRCKFNSDEAQNPILSGS
jgi:hypothetical protein